MTGPREWRHAELCAVVGGYEYGCNCGLSAVRDAIAAGHRVVIGPDGVEGRLGEDYTWIEEDEAWAYTVFPLVEP